MIALSIKQPWAFLILAGFKDVENRRWATARRGRFLIHASQTFDEAGLAWVTERFEALGMERPPPAEHAYARGAVIGSVDLVNCVRRYDSPWFEGPHGFVLSRPRPLPVRKVRGMLGFFELPEIYAQERRHERR